MRILIILILVIILFILNYKNHNENFDVTELDKLLDCSTDNTNNIVFNTILTKNITINGKALHTYLLDIAYPIGSFYVQFPDVSHNQVSQAFPDDKKPETLFGGVWELMWEKDDVFFRTEGSNSKMQRDLSGIQPDAIIDLQGSTAWIQADRGNAGRGSSGVFTVSTAGVRTDKGKGGSTGSRNFFDLSALIQTGNEVRVRNRIFRIWKRVA
jgi:hypothetical protein